jgi:hypothetical protein
MPGFASEVSASTSRMRRQGVPRAPGATRNLSAPAREDRVNGRTGTFQNRFYWENDGLMPDEVRAFLLTQQERQRVASNLPKPWLPWACSHRTSRDAVIPDDVKQFV